MRPKVLGSPLPARLGVFSTTLGTMFNFLREYVQLPLGVCSTTLGNMFTTLGSMLPLGVCSTTLRNIFNYPRECFQLPWGVWSTTLPENDLKKFGKPFNVFKRMSVVQNSDPPEAAPLPAPFLKIARRGKTFSIFWGMSFFQNLNRGRQHSC